MVGSFLPPGFRFHPTDEELFGYYLHRRNQELEIELEIIPLMDLYNFDPWELQEKSFLPIRDKEWFFFFHRDRKYQNGSRINRATKSGYWKATGKKSENQWVMHEYRLYDNDTSQGSLSFKKGNFGLCRVIKRNEITPKKCEIASMEVSDEPLKNNAKISCDTSNPTTEEYSQSQTEESLGFQVFAIPEFEYPAVDLADLNFDWEMENPFIFVNYQEARMNGEVIVRGGPRPNMV
ncbi:unnamed protein product [Cochlearia groenlandica]